MSVVRYVPGPGGQPPPPAAAEPASAIEKSPVIPNTGSSRLFMALSFLAARPTVRASADDAIDRYRPRPRGITSLPSAGWSPAAATLDGAIRLHSTASWIQHMTECRRELRVAVLTGIADGVSSRPADRAQLFDALSRARADSMDRLERPVPFLFLEFHFARQLPRHRSRIPQSQRRS